MLGDLSKFTVLCGQEVVDAITVSRTTSASGDEGLCAHQQRMAREGYLGAELVMSRYGYSVRYDSGLQNWGLLASSRAKEVDGTFESAANWAKAWQAQDPAKRYVWVRKVRA